MFATCVCLSAFIRLYLNGSSIFNHSSLQLSDVGSTNATGLHCRIISSTPIDRVDWIAPDGTSVSTGTVPGFRVTRDLLLVTLLRNSGIPREGMYGCAVENGTTTIEVLYVGLYNKGKG